MLLSHESRKTQAYMYVRAATRRVETDGTGFCCGLTRNCADHMKDEKSSAAVRGVVWRVNTRSPELRARFEMKSFLQRAGAVWCGQQFLKHKHLIQSVSVKSIFHGGIIRQVMARLWSVVEPRQTLKALSS